ncbi:MAG: TfoX/Sxy family protein [Actinomycetota bacterium]
MAFDDALAERVRESLASVRWVTEIRMFGGLCFTVRGNMAVGVVGSELMVRVAKEDGDALLERAHTRPMDFTGKQMRGFLYVARAGLRTKKSLQAWVDRGVGFASSLPPKKPSQRNAE